MTIRSTWMASGVALAGLGGLLMALPVGPASAEGRCGKYKMDGTGNCLTPQFYKCTRDWAKCSKACKGNSKCQEKCDDKYTPQCGD